MRAGRAACWLRRPGARGPGGRARGGRRAGAAGRARAAGVGPRTGRVERAPCGSDAGRALRGARGRPPPLLVGVGASRARADEARPSAAPVPREVHPAARRGAARRYVRPGGRVLDPFAGSGTTLVQCARIGLRRRRRRRRGVQLPADARQDGALRRVSPRERAARRRLAARTLAARGRAATSREWYAPRAAAELLHFRARCSTSTSTPTCSSRARPRRALGAAARPTSTSSSRRRRSVEPVLVPQAPADLPAGRGGRQVPRPLPRRHARPAEGVPARPGERRAAEVLHGDARERRARGRVRRRSSPRRRTRASSTTTSSTATPTSCSGWTIVASASWAQLRAGPAGPRSRSTVDGNLGSAASLRGVSARPERPCVIVVNDRRELYPEILERSGLRLDDRLERHVNRRTGRRAGEYFESVLIATSAPLRVG